jgi:cell pole-organizing protein PopZ
VEKAIALAQATRERKSTASTATVSTAKSKSAVTASAASTAKILSQVDAIKKSTKATPRMGVKSSGNGKPTTAPTAKAPALATKDTLKPTVLCRQPLRSLPNGVIQLHHRHLRFD